MRLTLKFRVAVAACLGAHFPSFAGELVCAGTVEHLAYHAGSTVGNLMLQLSSMNVPVFICTPDADTVIAGSPYITKPSACKAMYATFLAAKASGATISRVHFDGDSVPATCGAWSSWSSANVRYYNY